VRDGTETRERIERTALKLFVEQGYAETSIRDIAKAARVAQGTLYVHYPSKEQLAWTLFSKSFSEIGAELDRLARSEATLHARLRAMIGYVLGMFDRDRTLVSYVFLTRHTHLGRVTRRVGNPYLAFRRVVVDAIRHGEVPRKDPEVAAALVTGAIIQVIDVGIMGHIKGPLAARTDQVADACLALMAA